jgi:restriction system-associated AAA family ATPase
LKSKYDLPSNDNPSVKTSITITKNPNKEPVYEDLGVLTHTKDAKEFENATHPNRIIGYSSGMNELLSNPFIKMDFHYFEEFQKRMDNNKVFEGIEVNRMFFMDYDSNQMVVLANFLIESEDDKTHLDILNKELKIKDLQSFSISIRKKRYDGKAIEFPSELNDAINRLERCATCYTTKYEGKIEVIRLDYWVNDATKEAFRANFRTSVELFRYLYLLRLLNIHAYTPALRDTVREAGQGINLSTLIPKPEASELVFSIDELSFWKEGVDKPIHYKTLSDGEHQLLHVLGAIMLFDTDGTLFLLDEPETHFNPEWRSKFVSLINQTITEPRKQEILLSTHSPFIVSDCKPERVFIFENGKYRKPDFNTYGASINLISLKVFGKKETIAEGAMNRLRELRTEVENGIKTVEEAQKASQEELGDSVEKMIFMDTIKNISPPNS